MIGDRLEEAERRLLAGDSEGALRLLRGALRTAGTKRDAARLHAIVVLAQRVENESVGSLKKEASLLLFTARSDLASYLIMNVLARML